MVITPASRKVEITSSTPSTFPSPPKKKNSFSISFNQFHVHTPKGEGINKIYKSRKSKSYFFELADQNQNTNNIHLKIHTNDHRMTNIPKSYNSTSNFPNTKYQLSTMLTHFFIHQQVIPRRIQNKFFSLIQSKLLDRINILKSRGDNNDQKNNSTKSFFNFSYKRYRFYFGIYIPCNHENDLLKHPNHKFTCPIPAPFIMSKARRACVIHHKKLVIFHPPKEINNPPTPASYKDFHANLTYDNWNDRKVKHIYSNRLGINYQVKLQAKDEKGLKISQNKRFMYRKQLDHFQHNYSHNKRTAKKQKERFERHCRRDHNKANKQIATSTEDRQTNKQRRNKLNRARSLQKFLTSSNYSVHKHIHHLTYRDMPVYPIHSDYSFHIPISRSVTLKASDFINETLPPRYPNLDYSGIPSLSLPTVQIGEPNTGKQKEVITKKEDISIDELMKIHNIDECYRHLIPTTPIYRKTIANRKGVKTIQQQQIPLTPGSKNWVNHIFDLIGIADTGTSEKKYHERVNMVKDLTQFQNTFHKKMETFHFQELTAKSPGHERALKRKHAKFSLDYFEVNDPLDYHYTNKGNTSDDTKIIEYRPKKRDTTHNPNLLSITTHDYKKRKPITPSDTIDTTPDLK